jgi:hypothetical protein
MSMLLYPMWTVLSVLKYKWLMEPSTITIRTSEQWNIIIRLHIDDMVTIFHSILSTFENLGVIWDILLYSEDRVIMVETS